MPPSYSTFVRSIRPEMAFTVLAQARALIAAGKDVIELEIGDTPFPTPVHALEAGIDALRRGLTHYGPSVGLAEFRAAAAAYVNREYGLKATAEQVIAGPGAKNFEQLFCEAFVEPNDGVLVFSPHFPTYGPNIARRGGRMCLSTLIAERAFRPSLDDVQQFIDNDPSPKAIFLNSPNNPTGGVATEKDLAKLATLIRGRDIVVFSDEPYDRMVWNGKHHSLLAQPGMYEHTVAAYTFSKSFSMSGWRLGFAVTSAPTVARLDVLTNSAFSCVPPFTQIAGIAAMEHDRAQRDEWSDTFQAKVELLVGSLNTINGVSCLMPSGGFYAFPNVKAVCDEVGITSHGLARYLLDGADDQRGVACLGGECFGEAGRGYLRLSCAETNERLSDAVSFIAESLVRSDRLTAYVRRYPEHRTTTAHNPA